MGTSDLGTPTSAYEKGLADARTAARFTEIERRISELDRMSATHLANYEKTNENITELGRKFDKLVAAQAEREAVDAALRSALSDAAKKSVSTRTFILGLLGFLVAIATLIVTTASQTGSVKP